MTEEERREIVGQARQVERRLRELRDRIEDRVVRIDPNRRKVFHAKLDVTMTELLEPLYVDYTKSTVSRDRHITEMREQQDQVYLLSAELDRRARDAFRDIEDIAMEERRQHAEQLVREFEAERPGQAE